MPSDKHPEPAPTLEDAVGLLRLVAHQCPSCDQGKPGECSQECLDIPKNVAAAVEWLSRYDASRSPSTTVGEACDEGTDYAGCPKHGASCPAQAPVNGKGEGRG